MSVKEEKTRLNLNISKELVNRLEACAIRYGVSRSQLATMLIGQGVAGIEETFKTLNNLTVDLKNDIFNSTDKEI